jgi:hypothetical protein
MEIARAGVLARGGDHARRRGRAATGAEIAPFEQPEVGGQQGCGEAGEIDLQRRGDKENRAGVAWLDAAPQEGVGESLGLKGVPLADLWIAAAEGNIAASKLASSALRPSRQAGSRRCPSAAMGGMRAAIA